MSSAPASTCVIVLFALPFSPMSAIRLRRDSRLRVRRSHESARVEREIAGRPELHAIHHYVHRCDEPRSNGSCGRPVHMLLQA